MTNVKRFGYLTKDETKAAAEELITFFESERDEELGYIGAEELLDFFMQKIGPYIYNKGIEDSRDVLLKGIDNIGIEFSLLRKE